MKKLDKTIKLLEEIRDFLMEKSEKNRKGEIEIGDNFYYINAYGQVHEEIYKDNLECDNYISIGNFFETERKTEDKVKKLEAIVRVKKYIKDNLGYNPDTWADWLSPEDKLTLSVDTLDEIIHYDLHVRYKPTSDIGFLKSPNDCIELIKECKDDLLTILN